MRSEISKVIKKTAYPELTDALTVYEKEGRPFAAPRYKLQDFNSKKQRVSDLIGGFPFTSESYPWPIGGPDSLHMQPLVQVNLQRAGHLLGFDFGKGLLQVWSIIGHNENSLNTVAAAINTSFNGNFNECVVTRVIPLEELQKTPSNFFPEFCPWLKRTDEEDCPNGVLFIDPTEAMQQGSQVNWSLSKKLMYPIPHIAINKFATPTQDDGDTSENLDEYQFFWEFESNIRQYLRCSGNAGYYLGGTRSYEEGRYSDPAYNFPLLLNIGGDINVSVVFDNKNFLKPNIVHDNGISRIHFAREKMLKAVYYYTI